MATVILGNHFSVLVSRHARDGIRTFYCDVLGGEITKAQAERDFIRLGDDFLVFQYADVPDEDASVRRAGAPWLEIASDDVAQTARRIRDSGLVRELDVPDRHFYFQLPGGQCMRLVGTDEDLSLYEGAGPG